MGLTELTHHLLHQRIKGGIRLFFFDPWAVNLAHGIPVSSDLTGIPVACLDPGPNRFKGPDALCLCQAIKRAKQHQAKPFLTTPANQLDTGRGKRHWHHVLRSTDSFINIRAASQTASTA